MQLATIHQVLVGEWGRASTIRVRGCGEDKASSGSPSRLTDLGARSSPLSKGPILKGMWPGVSQVAGKKQLAKDSKNTGSRTQPCSEEAQSLPRDALRDGSHRTLGCEELERGGVRSWVNKRSIRSHSCCLSSEVLRRKDSCGPGLTRILPPA